MGRAKLCIKRRETMSARNATFSKRNDGLMKKSFELATLCDTDVLAITHSPSGKIFTFPNVGNKSFEDVIKRYADMPKEEKKRRKRESLEALLRINQNYAQESESPMEEAWSSPSSGESEVARLHQDNVELDMIEKEIKRTTHEFEYLERKLRILKGDDYSQIGTMEDLEEFEIRLQSILHMVLEHKKNKMDPITLSSLEEFLLGEARGQDFQQNVQHNEDHIMRATLSSIDDFPNTMSNKEFVETTTNLQPFPLDAATNACHPTYPNHME
ncbi:hypothetical protein O6H91_Y381400 [Diphasiastrum complanatum]|nr:hypothetical protein O6H91_Y381400 [Diphasiastrum complanatum]